MRLTFILFIAVMITGCTFNHPDKPVKEWEELIIKEHATKFIISNYDDSSKVIFYNIGSFFQPVKKVTIDTIRVFYTRSDKDSLAMLSQSLITRPAVPRQFCTEFIGLLRITLQSGQVTQTVEYNSTCDWTKLSDTTMMLNRILQRGLKRSQKSNSLSKTSNF